MDLSFHVWRPRTSWRALAASLPCRDLNLATLLIFCALLFPFVLSYHPYPIPSFYQEWLAIFLSLAAAILVTAKYRSERFELPFATWIPLALLPSVLIHLVAGNELIVHGPPLHLISMGSAALLMILGRKLCAERDAIPLADIMAGAFVTGALAASVASWHWRFQTGLLDPLPWAPANGWLGQRNQHALHIWLGILGISHFVLNRKLSWFHYLVCLEILAETAIYTESRSVYLYAAASLALGVWAAAKSSLPDTRKRLLLIAICPVIFLAAIHGTRLLRDHDWGLDTVANSQSNTGAIDRYAPATLARDDRLGIWLAAARLIQANPWIGSGPGSFIRESWLLSDSLPSTVPMALPASHAHNVFLQISAELGAPTALGFAGLIAAWLVFALRQRNWREKWLHVAIPLAILTHNQVEFSLWYLYFLVPAALSMGAASRMQPERSIPALTVLVVAMFGFGLAAQFSQSYLILETLFRQSTSRQEEATAPLAAAKHPVFGAWASARIAGRSWHGISKQAQYQHAARALYVAPLDKATVDTYIESLDSAGKPAAAAREQRVSQRAFAN